MFKRRRGLGGQQVNDTQKNQSADQKVMLQLDLTKLPHHIAIIMDGNGRWATQKGLPRAFGHRAGVRALREVVKLCVELKLAHLTVYAFSTENWKRPREEINILMGLLVEYLHLEIDELHSNNVQINAMGMLLDLPVQAQKAVHTAMEKTKHNTGLVFNIALNYGGRAELVQAIQAIGHKLIHKQLKLEEINEQVIANHLYTTGQPDPDLLIRPAGDYRVSNFLLWQLAYTEFWHTDTMWPDFGRQQILQALLDFQRRERRFGGLLHH